MKYLFILFIFIFTFLIVQDGYSLTETYKVKKVIPPLTLELENGETVALGGIEVIDSQRQFLENFLNRIIAEIEIIVEADSQNSSVFYVYIWKGRKFFDKLGIYKEWQAKGFLDVKSDFFGVRKGLALNLNAYLIRKGFVSVDNSIEFMFKDGFLDEQKRFQTKE